MTAASAGETWRSLIEELLPLGERAAEMFPESRDPWLREELLRMTYSELGAGFMQMVHADAEYPDFVPCWSQVFSNNGNINPDAVYYFTLLDDDGVYRLSGFRGSLHIVDLQLGNSSVYATGKLNEQRNFGPTLANYDLDSDVALGADGGFEVVLSAKRPDGYDGDWWQLPPSTNYLLVRQFAYDWIGEVDARIAIDRLDRPAARPRSPAGRTSAALARIPEFVHSRLTTLALAAHNERGLGSPALTNRVVLIDYTSDQAGRAAQLYLAGRFELAADEALVVELDPGDCRYWNIQICNELTSTLDFMNRLVALNGFQARRSSDGCYRLVVAACDPGVPNWLDTVGHERGFVWGRIDGGPAGETRQPPATTRLRLADVRGALPVDTPVVTADERDAELRQRRKGAQLRRRW